MTKKPAKFPKDPAKTVEGVAKTVGEVAQDTHCIYALNPKITSPNCEKSGKI